MPHDITLISTIAVAFASAFIFGFAANRLGFSPLVGYLVAGVTVGPFSPGFVVDHLDRVLEATAAALRRACRGETRSHSDHQCTKGDET